MRRHIVSIVLILLVLSLLAPVVALGETWGKVDIPNVTYLTVRESDGEVHSVRTYFKDGQMYMEMDGQLYVMDILKEVVGPILEDNLEEALQAFEARKVGEEVFDGHRTVHYQVFSSKTGLLEQESWQALDLPMSLALKTISYDPEGNVVSVTQILDVEFDPDFSGNDFSNALRFPVLEGPRVATPLTTEEFKYMVPWYDLTLQPLPNCELTDLNYVATYGALWFTLTYSTDSEQQIQIMIYGDPTKLTETHGPSEFDLLLNVKFSEFTLEPAMRSGRTDVLVGFLNSFDRSDGNIFLRNVVLHPTLQ